MLKKRQSDGLRKSDKGCEPRDRLETIDSKMQENDKLNKDVIIESGTSTQMHNRQPSFKY